MVATLEFNPDLGYRGLIDVLNTPYDEKNQSAIKTCFHVLSDSFEFGLRRPPGAPGITREGLKTILAAMKTEEAKGEWTGPETPEEVHELNVITLVEWGLID